MSESCVVLVHGLWHGAWAWDPVRRRLDLAGVASAAVELPMTTLADDVAVVRNALEVVGSPVVLAAIPTAGGHHRRRHAPRGAATRLPRRIPVGRRREHFARGA